MTAEAVRNAVWGGGLRLPQEPQRQQQQQCMRRPERALPLWGGKIQESRGMEGYAQPGGEQELPERGGDLIENGEKQGHPQIGAQKTAGAERQPERLQQHGQGTRGPGCRGNGRDRGGTARRCAEGGFPGPGRGQKLPDHQQPGQRTHPAGGQRREGRQHGAHMCSPQ